jgi:hypothetical protein
MIKHLLLATLSYLIVNVAIAQCGTNPAVTTTTISTINTIVNTYYAGQGNPIAGTSNLTVDLTSIRGSSAPLAANDLILIIQMQGADLNTSNSDAYGNGVVGVPGSGALTSNLYAGSYEYNSIVSITAGGGITLASPLVNNYFTNTLPKRAYQVIRVPRYHNVTINSTASITASPWNGVSGGVVVIDAVSVANISGSVNVTGLGFRGGGGKQLNGATPGNSNGSTAITNTDFRFNSPVTTAANATGGAKGEGIAGTPSYVLPNGATQTVTLTEGYVGGSMGRGAPGNAGGGSTDGAPLNNGFNSGGGGGANAGNGGNGGSGWHGGSGTVNTYPNGGYGGTAFTSHSIKRLIMGGGGGAGSANNSTSVASNTTPPVPPDEYQSSGGSGGGIIIIRAGSYTGNGSLQANGGAAPGVTGTLAGSTHTSNTDAAGGGGAGGTILVVTRAAGTTGLNTITASATGGAGGTMSNYFDHGPGGGGGGGIIYTNGTFASTIISGGVNGKTRTGSTGGALTNDFGSTSGTAGQLVTLSGVPLLVNANGAISNCGVLPLTLVNFSGVIKTNGVQTNWEITNAVNVSHFEIEYSKDGSTYQTAGKTSYVAGTTSYSFLHSIHSSALTYYRLKSVDKNGEYSYSKVISLRRNTEQQPVTLYPNPATRSVTLTYRSATAIAATIQLIDAAGKIIIEQPVALQTGDNTIPLDITAATTGLYIVQIKVKDGTIHNERLQVIRK